jgi:hypothetical protein
MILACFNRRQQCWLNLFSEKQNGEQLSKLLAVTLIFACNYRELYSVITGSGSNGWLTEALVAFTWAAPCPMSVALAGELSFT